MSKVDEMQKLVNEIVVNITEKDGQAVVSSRDIAENFEKEHKNVVRAIENLTAQNCTVKNMFVEDKFNHRGNIYKHYWMNRDGFSLLVMGFTGQKALEWKLKYIEAFNKMESTIKNNMNPFQGMSKELQAILLVDKKQQANERKINAVAEDLKDFKENAPLFNIECEELQKALRAKVISEMGGKKSEAYNDKSLRTKVFSDAQRQIKREFGLTSYKAIKRVQFEKALEIIANYKVPLVLKEAIDCLNSQFTMQNINLMREKDNLVRLC